MEKTTTELLIEAREKKVVLLNTIFLYGKRNNRDAQLLHLDAEINQLELKLLKEKK